MTLSVLNSEGRGKYDGSGNVTVSNVYRFTINLLKFFLHSLIGARTRVVEYNHTPLVYTLGCALCYEQVT